MDTEDITEPQTADVSFSFAEQHGVMVDGNTVYHYGDVDTSIMLELQRVLGTQLSFQRMDEAVFKKELTQKYQTVDGAAQRAADDLDAEMDLGQIADDLQQQTDLLAGNDDAPVIRLINAILSEAVKEKVSDIHIEPYEDRVAIRFRVDGVLKEMLSPKPELASVLVSRLKVMGKLDIAEKRLPQDGRISIRIAGHGVDIRMSTIPSSYGERVVLRLLDQAAGQLQLDQLAMPPALHQLFADCLSRPHGIILVTGPTGSGKTTTLYAGLTHINDRSRNILTIEDPVEYLLAGIGQTQVNPKVDMTFARGLRAILRQDPDVVMIGEIRDQETASIAVQASLTGHLVLSTLHTNTAIGAITRLKDMGVGPFLLSSSLEMVMAQRLVRLLCDRCREPQAPTPAERSRLSLAEDNTIYRAVGCDHCNQTGYRGRTAIYEIIQIDSELRQLIHEGVGEQVMLKYARQHAPSLMENGRHRILAGETSIEEVLRVTVVS
ncbi:type II secretion system protein GspE [Candidatus Endobugula sertula]|uniref:Type II secretion system protein E n=1 Tax=Candidatus Endobugula sertula TaxID=62101 RepID=A0A1D2QSN2_9GAMM|nr:type II secretion system protein GspE [Candidatus Endobugula sertula]